MATLHRGVTALELMIALAIIALLFAAGVPTARKLTRNTALDAAVGQLHSDLALARNQAILRGGATVVCPARQPAGCDAGTHWQAGWLLFQDFNGDRERQPAEPLLRHGQPAPGVRIQSSAGRTRLRFTPSGAAAGSNVRIAFCAGPEAVPARYLFVSNSGRIRTAEAPADAPPECP